jgi:hypothetical protein
MVDQKASKYYAAEEEQQMKKVRVLIVASRAQYTLRSF